MSEFFKTDKKVIIVLSLGLCLLGGIVFARLYQPHKKTLRIYSQALENYKSKDYSNSYYLFSKIGYFSNLKPYALYRQAMAAHALGDSASEAEIYQILFKRFPTNHLSTEAKYKTAQLISDSNPEQALKYFNEIIASNANEDYKIASAYYKSKIESENPNTTLNKNEIENGFRQYLEKYPDGRLALQVAKNWLIYNPELNSKDNALAAKALILGNLNNDAAKILKHSDMKDSWAIQALNLYGLGNISDGNRIIETGISEYSDNVSSDDYRLALDECLRKNDKPYDTASNLLNIAKGKNKDYIWNLKCKNSPIGEKYSCYENLYTAYPEGDFAQNAMINSMLGKILNKNYAGAKNIADNFVLKYPDSENLDMVMLWRAKIEQKYTHNPNYEIFYRNVINNYPDSYFAYRAFWIIQNLNSFVMNSQLEYKPVEYPYKYPLKGSTLYNLILVNDYEMIGKYTNDEFIKSWLQYKKGSYVTSIYTAQKAMEKLKTKPPKDDPRWRLVYPLNYFKQIENESGHFGNDLALIFAIVREESHFNPYAQSEVGAIGLMQLMPNTAHEVGNKAGYEFNTSDLFNPELNIKIGNMYYSQLQNALKHNAIMAIAAYNGGIGSVQKWKNNFAFEDIDNFVEQIPYDETKNYVYKVMKSYWNYTRIYQK